jgi:hypothetical protein
VIRDFKGVYIECLVHTSRQWDTSSTSAHIRPKSVQYFFPVLYSSISITVALKSDDVVVQVLYYYYSYSRKKMSCGCACGPKV